MGTPVNALEVVPVAARELVRSQHGYDGSVLGVVIRLTRLSALESSTRVLEVHELSSFENHHGWPTPDQATCIRCDAAAIVDENGYCGCCYWAVRAEVERGLYQFAERLRKEARFQEWLAQHPEAA